MAYDIGNPFEGFPGIWHFVNKAAADGARLDAAEARKKNKDLEKDNAALRQEVERLRDLIAQAENTVTMYRMRAAAARRSVAALAAQLAGRCPELARSCPDLEDPDYYGIKVLIDFTLREYYKAGWTLSPVIKDNQAAAEVLSCWPQCAQCAHKLPPDVVKCRDCGADRYAPAATPVVEEEASKDSFVGDWIPALDETMVE